MELERVARDAWAIPQACAMCGEPSTDGKPFVANVTLKREYNTDMVGKLQSVGTTSLDFRFPTCAACTNARKSKSRRDGLVGGLGIVLGIIGLGVVQGLAGYDWVSCASLLVIWLVAMVALDRLVDRAWRRRASEDEQRRAKLSVPVSVRRVGRQGIAPLLKFTFENDEYGEAFSIMNP